jgi:LysM repeat protein
MLGTVQPATIERSVVGHPAAGRPATSRSSTGRAARHLDTSDPERRACDLREATPTRAGVAAEPRGLGRRRPRRPPPPPPPRNMAGAGLLATVHRPPLGVLPGSVKTPAGYVYVVRPGDTLWSIASRLQPGGDPRVLVAKLERQVSAGTLEPGSRLMLP